MISGVDPGFQVREGAFKKIAPSGGRREHFWGISCEKSRFYAKKIIFFPIIGGARPPPLNPLLELLDPNCKGSKHDLIDLSGNDSISELSCNIAEYDLIDHSGNDSISTISLVYNYFI
jgi:hypothetical protein